MSGDWAIEQTGEPLVPEMPDDHSWRDEQRGDDDELDADEPEQPRRQPFGLPDRDGYTLGDPKLVTLDRQGGAW